MTDRAAIIEALNPNVDLPINQMGVPDFVQN